MALRQTLRCSLLAVFLAPMAAASPACAQGKLDAQYTATLAGIPIGKGSWLIDIADTQFSATANGRTTGLLRVFANGEGTSAAHGTLQGGRLVSTIYSSIITSSKKKDEIRLTTANGNVKDFAVDPPVDNDPERLPITEAHQHGVLDPMTASLIHVPGNGDPLSPEACKQTTAIFDGRLRYDLQFVFKRMDKVKADKGYAGPVVVCAVYFSPIAGYVPARASIKYLAKQRDIEVWMAPIAGTRVLVPFRLEGPTPVGRAVLEATEFVSVAAPTRASANGTKTTQ
ncbi:MAG TPA: DUF3108 domain-containing protein [Pseudolabrys sp.]